MRRRLPALRCIPTLDSILRRAAWSARSRLFPQFHLWPAFRVSNWRLFPSVVQTRVAIRLSTVALGRPRRAAALGCAAGQPWQAFGPYFWVFSSAPFAPFRRLSVEALSFRGKAVRASLRFNALLVQFSKKRNLSPLSFRLRRRRLRPYSAPDVFAIDVRRPSSLCARPGFASYSLRPCAAAMPAGHRAKCALCSRLFNACARPGPPDQCGARNHFTALSKNRPRHFARFVQGRSRLWAKPTLSGRVQWVDPGVGTLASCSDALGDTGIKKISHIFCGNRGGYLPWCQAAVLPFAYGSVMPGSPWASLPAVPEEGTACRGSHGE